MSSTMAARSVVRIPNKSFLSTEVWEITGGFELKPDLEKTLDKEVPG